MKLQLRIKKSTTKAGMLHDSIIQLPSFRCITVSNSGAVTTCRLWKHRRVQQTLPSMNGRRPKQCSPFFCTKKDCSGLNDFHLLHDCVVTPSSTSSPQKNGFLPKFPPVTPVFFWARKRVAEEHHAHHAPSHLAPPPWRSSLSVRSARLKCWEPRSIRFNGSEVGIATLAGLALGFPTGSFTDLVNLRRSWGASNS